MHRFPEGRLAVVLIVLVHLGFLAGDAGAQKPYLVRDVDTTAAGSQPRGFTEAGGIVYFAADAPELGRELWKTDGTREGTVLVKDLYPGPGSSYPGGFVELGGVVYFTAYGAASNPLLWRTDGTAAGTTPAVELCAAGEVCSFGSELVAFGDELFFAAHDRESGTELWASDGTAAGTRRVLDIRPGALGSSPRKLAVSGGRLFFIAEDGTHHRELWVSDGTAAGTRMVKDIRPEWHGLDHDEDLVEFGGELYFAATEPETGRELWKSDGTAAGTLLVADVNPGSRWGMGRDLEPAGGILFFPADDEVHGEELWATDGTAAGTRLVADLAQEKNHEDGSEPSMLTAVGTEVFFRATDRVSGDEVWKSDGTAAGTVRVADLRPGPGTSDPTQLVDFGGTLFFSADDGTSGAELWKSHGTAAGTVRVADVAPGAPGSEPSDLSVAAGLLFFSADDGESGREPWRSDGTASGTFRLADVNATGNEGSFPLSVAAAGGKVYFTAHHDGDPEERRLWVSDGSPEGTVRLSDTLIVFGLPQIAAVGETVFFEAFADEAGPSELFATEGTRESVRRVADAAPVLAGRPPSWLTAVGDRLFFTLRDSGEGSVLWTTDGTAAGTARVAAVAPDRFHPRPFGLTALGERLVYAVESGERAGLWVSDGTAAGTRQLSDVAIEFELDGRFTATSSHVFFPGSGPAFDRSMWSTDGTAAGTAPLLTDAGLALRQPGGVVIAGGRAFFEANGGTGLALWSSDGRDVERVFAGGVTMLDGAGGELYFTPGVSGELWRSDGTAAGTVRVVDGSAFLGPLRVGFGHRDLFYFVAETPAVGAELWVSDGTAAGTRLVADLWPGPDSPTFWNPLPAGDTLFFTSTDGVRGLELWAIKTPCARRGPQALCLVDGRFQVEVAWRDFAGGSGAGTALAVNDDSGAFWFFSESNVELLVKVIDGRVLNGHWWLFYASLSNVELELTVTDLESGRVKRFHNPPGTFASAGDVTAFPGP